MDDSNVCGHSWAIRPSWVLAGIVLGCVALNIFIFRLTDVEPEPPDWLLGVIFGCLVYEPMLFGVWAALGPGYFLIRLSLIIPSLLFISASPGLFPSAFQDVERYEFIVTTVATLVIFGAATALLLFIRWVFKFHIEPPQAVSSSQADRLQFDTRYLIILITLCAIVLGMMSNLKFKPPEPPPFLFGPEFVMNMVAIGGALFSFLLLPVLAVPLLLLSARVSKRAIFWAISFWASVTSLAALIWLSIGGESLPMAGAMLQLGAAVLGIAVVFPLRIIGYRLVTAPK